MIVITNLKGDVVYVNRSFESRTGYSREEVKGRSTQFLNAGGQDRAYFRILWDTIRSGGVWQGEFRNRTKQGTILIESATISPLVDSTGEIGGFLAIKRDVTMQRQLQERLQRLQKMEVVGQMASGIAHDFNNALAAMDGYLMMLEHDLQGDVRVDKHLESLRNVCSHAIDLSRQWLGFGRNDALEVFPHDLCDLITRLREGLFRSFEREVTLEFDLPDGLPTVWVDEVLFDQVLMNLAINARDAMGGAGTLVVRASCCVIDSVVSLRHGLPPGREAVQVQVSDSGPGIPKEIADRIFDPFFTTKGVDKGTGLGLYIVESTMARMGGAIELLSSSDEGTTFSLILPTWAPRAGETEPRDQILANLSFWLVAFPSPWIEGMRVRLEQLGAAVEVLDGMAVLEERFGQSSGDCHLIFFDIDQTVSLDVIEIWRGRHPSIPLIAVSRHPRSQFEEFLSDRPGLEFLRQPSRDEDILTLIWESIPIGRA